MQNELKAAADKALAIYDAEKARLTDAGMKSKDRYEALKPFKAAADEAYAAYHAVAMKKVLGRVRAYTNEVNREKRAAKLARSPYQQRKAAGKQLHA